MSNTESSVPHRQSQRERGLNIKHQLLNCMIGVGLILLIAGIGLSTLRSSQLGGVVVAPDKVEVIPQSTREVRRSVEITLTNKGPWPITIQSVNATCGCTQVSSVSGRVISARDHLVFNATVELPIGNDKEVAIVVRTDSISTPMITIPILVRARPLENSMISQQPETLVLRGRQPSQIVKHEFDVVTTEPPGSNHPFLIGARTDIGNARIEIIDFGESMKLNARQWIRTSRLCISSVTPDDLDVVLMGRIYLETVKPEHSAKSIPFKVVLEPSVRFVPDRLQFQVGDETILPVEKTVIVRHDEGSTLHDLRSEVDWLNVHIDPHEPAEDSAMSIIKVQLLRRPEADSSGSIVLTGGVKEQEQFSLPVIVLSKNRSTE